MEAERPRSPTFQFAAPRDSSRRRRRRRGSTRAFRHRRHHLAVAERSRPDRRRLWVSPPHAPTQQHGPGTHEDEQQASKDSLSETDDRLRPGVRQTGGVSPEWPPCFEGARAGPRELPSRSCRGGQRSVPGVGAEVHVIARPGQRSDRSRSSSRRSCTCVRHCKRGARGGDGQRRHDRCSQVRRSSHCQGAPSMSSSGSPVQRGASLATANAAANASA